MGEGTEGLGWAIAIILLVVISATIMAFVDTQNKYKELGQAICEEEYGADTKFDELKNNMIYCEPTAIVDEFDGLGITNNAAPGLR